MAVLVSDVLAPKGEVEPTMFPGEGSGAEGTALYARLLEYVTEGRRRAIDLDLEDPDDGARKWAYYRAFRSKCVTLNALPSSIEQTEQGSHGYAADQRKTICGLAEYWLSEFNNLVPDTAVQPVDGPQTRSTPNNFSW